MSDNTMEKKEQDLNRIKHLIFYGVYEDENIDHITESPKHIDYALTQAFIWMKESSRFHAENVERILWKRIGILAQKQQESDAVEFAEWKHEYLLDDGKMTHSELATRDSLSNQELYKIFTDGRI